MRAMRQLSCSGKRKNSYAEMGEQYEEHRGAAGGVKELQARAIEMTRTIVRRQYDPLKQVAFRAEP